MGRRKKEVSIQAAVECCGAGIAQGIGRLVVQYYKNPENVKAFQEWQAAQAREVSPKAS